MTSEPLNEAVFLTETSPHFLQSLDMKFNQGDPAKITVSSTIVVVNQVLLLEENQLVELKVSVLEKRGSLYFLTFTGPLSVDFSRDIDTTKKISQTYKAISI